MRRGDFKVTFDVYVDKEGRFTTTIPIEISKKLEDAKIKLSYNRNKKPGFYSGNSIGELYESIKATIEEYLKYK